jgi:hypothetical protein
MIWASGCWSRWAIAAWASSSAGRTGGVELAQQGGQLNAHRVFDHWRLMQVGVGEHLAQPLDVAVEVT